MKYSVSYEIPSEGVDSRHIRYYNALNKATVLEMFKATCEESLVGHDPHVVEVKQIEKEDDRDNS